MNLSRPPKGANDDDAADAPTPPDIDHRQHGLRDGLPGLRDLMERLLAPDGCPWDREQTLQTLRPYLLEEAHEVLEAMDDPQEHRSELGDLLFQIVFQAALRERKGQFDLDGVIEAIRSKMIRRHPHVFGDRRGSNLSAQDVEQQWATIKQTERSQGGPPDPLAGVPTTLPALSRAWRLQNKAAAVGFDWPTVDGALEKFREEWAEFEQAREQGDPDHLLEEFGDLLFVLVRIGQKLDLDAEDALRRANAKFVRRFAYMMRQCHAADRDPTDVGLETLEHWWQKAKSHERAKANGTREPAVEPK